MRRILALLALLALAAPALAQTGAEADRGFLQGLLEDNLSGAGREVRIEGFAGALSSRATFSTLTIADEAGVWLSIREGAISWNRAALLSGRIEIAELGAAEIVLERLPATAPAAAVPEAVPFSLPELPVSVAIGSIATKRLALGAPVLGAPVVLRLDGSLNLAGGAGSARLDAARIDGLAGSFSLRAEFSNATRAIVLDLLLDEAAGGIAATALGLPERPALRLAVAGSGTPEDFSADIRLASAGAQRLAGKVVLSAPDAATRRFAADLAGDISPLLAPDYRGFFGADTRLRAEGQRLADGGLQLSALNVHSAAVALQGSLDLLPSGLPARAALTLTLGLPDLPEVLLPIGGERTWVSGASLALGYDRALGDGWEVQGSLAGLRRAGLRVAEVALSGLGQIAEGAADQLSGSFDFAARGVALADPALSAALGETLQGRVQLDWRRGEPLRLPMLNLTAGAASLAGTAEVVTAGAQTRLSGNFRLGYPDLAQLSPLVGLPLGGRFDGVVEGWYRPLQGDFFLETAFIAIDLKTGQPLLDPLLAGGSRLRVIAERSATGLTLAVDTNARGFSGQAEVLLRSGATSGTARFAVPDLALAGGGLRGALAAEATLDGAPGARVIGISGTGSGLGLGEPTLDALLAGDAVLQAALTEGKQGFALGAASLQNPQLLARLGAAGSDGARQLSAEISDLALLAPGFPGLAAVTGQVLPGEGSYGLALAASGPGGLVATIAGPVASDFAQADLAIAGRAEAGLLNRLLAPQSLQGPLAFDLRLAGAPGLAALSGRISGEGLRFVDPGLGLSVERIALAGELAAGRARISASGAIGGGTVRISGPVDARPPYAADLALTLREVPLRDPNLYETRVSGALSATGPLAGGAMLSGDISLGETTLRVPEAGSASALPDVLHIAAPAEVTATRRHAGLLGGSAAERGGPVYGLDIGVSAPRRIFVRGRGLDAELGGALRLGGTTAAVLPSGQFELIRGRLDILGKRFTLTEGLVQLQGALVPWLRFVATSVQQGITATITLEGEASAPVLRLGSSPELPPDEVLSQLLFARGIENLSALQAAQMAQAVAQLAGRGGEGIMGRLRAAFGLDDLDLATDAGGATTLRLGKYLADSVYTDVAVGGDGKVEINLNLDLTPSLTARGTLGADGSSGLGLYFERDY